MGCGTRTYQYDSLGNLIFETRSQGNRNREYWHNNLNQIVRQVNAPNREYTHTYDNRGNLIQTTFHQNRNHSFVVAEFVYDATNRMVRGTNADGEQSSYIFNGLGDLVANEWLIDRNNYGYTGLPSSPTPDANNRILVRKDFVLDYTSWLRNVIMEYESIVGGLTYRYVYHDSLRKHSVVIYGIPVGVGATVQYRHQNASGGITLSPAAPEGIPSDRIVKLYYHHDRLGTTHYLTDNVRGAVTSFVSYDAWGMITSNTVLRLGQRELDLVTEFTGHSWDPVLGMYYARARMYDAANRRFTAVDPFWNAHNQPTVAESVPLCAQPSARAGRFGWVATVSADVFSQHRKPNLHFDYPEYSRRFPCYGCLQSAW